MQSLSQLEKKGHQRKCQLDFPCQPYPNFIPSSFRASIEISFLSLRRATVVPGSSLFDRSPHTLSSIPPLPYRYRRPRYLDLQRWIPKKHLPKWTIHLRASQLTLPMKNLLLHIYEPIIPRPGIPLEVDLVGQGEEVLKRTPKVDLVNIVQIIQG